MKELQFVNMCKEAIEKLEQQGKCSVDEYEGCFYLQHIDGKKLCCIVGFMMPDDETRQCADSLPDGSVEHLEEYGVAWANQFTAQQMGVLKKLQEEHDDTESVNKSFVDKIYNMIRIVDEYEA